MQALRNEGMAALVIWKCENDKMIECLNACMMQ